MKQSERFALNEWLSEYPENKSFDDILYLLLDDEDDSVIPWEVVEDYPRRDIAQFISNTQTHFATVTNEDVK
jgi:hypothetical protein